MYGIAYIKVSTPVDEDEKVYILGAVHFYSFSNKKQRNEEKDNRGKPQK